MDFDDQSGLGDIGFDLAYIRAYKSGWQTAIGMAGTLPTGTDSKLTGGQLRLGPDWMIGLNVTPIVPNFIENMFKGK